MQAHLDNVTVVTDIVGNRPEHIIELGSCNNLGTPMDVTQQKEQSTRISWW